MSAYELYRAYTAEEIGQTSTEGFVMGAERPALLVELAGAEGPRFFERSTLERSGSVPAPILAQRLSVDLFLAQKGRFIYLGEARVVAHGRRAEGQALSATFSVQPALPRELWRSLYRETTRTRAPNQPAETVIKALSATSTTSDRMTALRSFVTAWHGASSERPIAIDPTFPAPLREFHSLVSGRPRVLVQNSLIEPSELVVEDGRVLFYIENQGVCLWSTEPQGADPPVYFRMNEKGALWRREAEPLSGFLIQLALYEAILGSEIGAWSACVDSSVVERLCGLMQPLPLGRWFWPGVCTSDANDPASSRFHARDGALMFVSPNGSEFDVFLAAREPAALDFADAVVDETWDQIAY